MQLVMGIGLDFINADDFKNAGLQEVIVIIGVSVVLFALVKSLPDAIAGVINGSNVSSGNALGQAMTTIVTGAAAAVGGAVGGVAGAQAATSAVKNAAKLAGESGASGMGAVGHMAKSLWGAHQDSKHDFDLEAMATFDGDFVAAIKQLFLGLHRSGNALRVTVYQSNKVVEVAED